MICMGVPVHPKRANQTQHPNLEGSDPVAEIEDVISPLSKRRCCQIVAGQSHHGCYDWQLHGEGFGSRTIHAAFQLVAFFSVELTFATTKDTHLELGLKGLEVLYLGVIMDIKGKSINIGKGNMDVSIRFDMAKGVAKG